MPNMEDKATSAGILNLDDFPLKPLTDGVERVLQGVKEWQRMFEEAFERLRFSQETAPIRRGRRPIDPVYKLGRAETELKQFIDVTIDRESQFAKLIVEAFELQKAEVEKYFEALPYRNELIDAEHEIILNILAKKEIDLKRQIVHRMTVNRQWMQSILETIGEEKREWDKMIKRQRVEE